jgi:hypothetical protein
VAGSKVSVPARGAFESRTSTTFLTFTANSTQAVLQPPALRLLLRQLGWAGFGWWAAPADSGDILASPDSGSEMA